MDEKIKTALAQFAGKAISLLGNNIIAAYCFGSACYGDFHLGYSDLDFFLVVRGSLTEDDFRDFHALRQEYKAGEDPYLAVLEGEIAPYTGLKTRVGNTIYWGTSRDRFNWGYELKGFSMRGLLEVGYLIWGQDIRQEIPYPSEAEMRAQVVSMVETIRKHGAKTDEDVHSADWFFLISQSLYWLRTGKITGKTQAARWVLANCAYGWQDTLDRAIRLRLNPGLAREGTWRQWLAGLGSVVQQACDSLAAALDSLQHYYDWGDPR